MYKDGFVVNVVNKGEILDDKNGTAALPFNSEYEIRLKNKNSRDSVAKVFVDGREVTRAGDLIVRENQTVNLERFIDSVHSGRKFKFVPLGQGEEGDSDKGVIEVRFRLVRERSYPIIWNPPRIVDHYHYPVYIERPYSRPSVTWDASATTKGLSGGGTFTTSGNINSCYCSSTSSNFNVSDVDGGKTVEGGHSGQNFSYDWVGELEYQETIIRLKIVGFKSDVVLRPKEKEEINRQIEALEQQMKELKEKVR